MHYRRTTFACLLTGLTVLGSAQADPLSPPSAAPIVVQASFASPRALLPNLGMGSSTTYTQADFTGGPMPLSHGKTLMVDLGTKPWTSIAINNLVSTYQHNYTTQGHFGFTARQSSNLDTMRDVLTKARFYGHAAVGISDPIARDPDFAKNFTTFARALKQSPSAGVILYSAAAEAGRPSLEAQRATLEAAIISAKVGLPTLVTGTFSKDALEEEFARLPEPAAKNLMVRRETLQAASPEMRNQLFQQGVGVTVSSPAQPDLSYVWQRTADNISGRGSFTATLFNPRGQAISTKSFNSLAAFWQATMEDPEKIK